MNIEQQNCFKKKRYYNLDKAKSDAKRHNFRAYQCPVCSFYHLTKNLVDIKARIENRQSET